MVCLSTEYYLKSTELKFGSFSFNKTSRISTSFQSSHFLICKNLNHLKTSGGLLEHNGWNTTLLKQAESFCADFYISLHKVKYTELRSINKFTSRELIHSRTSIFFLFLIQYRFSGIDYALLQYSHDYTLSYRRYRSEVYLK